MSAGIAAVTEPEGFAGNYPNELGAGRPNAGRPRCLRRAALFQRM